MSSVKEILAAHKYPEFVRNHKAFKSITEIKKVFPHIGLSNCEEEIAIDNSQEVIASATYLINAISHEVSQRHHKLVNFGEKKTKPGIKRMKVDRKAKFETCSTLLAAVKDALTKQSKQTITNNNGRITLNLPIDIKGKDEKAVFKSGEGLFRVYGKLNEMLRDGRFLPMPKIEEMAWFKDFSSKNIPSIKHKIVFSSEGIEGIWDIATMSMRGIQSCQTWGGTNSYHVVGSMIDPFTGIIYLTSGAKHGEYGTKMMRRCIVRFVIREKDKQPCLYLERMYPAYDKSTMTAFIEFLRKKIENKYPVVDGQNIGGAGYYVPMANTIKNLDQQHQPYRDSGTTYKIDAADAIGAMREKANSVFGKVHAAVGAKVLATTRTMKMISIPEDYKETFRMIRGTSTYNDLSYLVYDDLVNMSKRFFDSIDFSKYDEPTKAIEDGLAKFSEGLEGRVADCLKTSIKQRMNNVYMSGKNKYQSKLPEKVVKSLSENASKKISGFLADELKTVAKMKKEAMKIKPEELPVYVKLLN